MSLYPLLAPLYDIIHAELVDDIPFVQSLAAKAGGSVLDIGCGTGRLTLPLAAAGLTVVGIDNSAEMLAIGRQHANKHPRITWLQADALTLDLPQRFPFAVASHNTAMHFSQGQLQTLFKTVARHLSAEGQFLIDFSNPFELSEAPNQPEFEFEDELMLDSGEVVMQHARWTHNEAAQAISVEWLYEPQSAEPFTTQTVYYYLYPHVIQSLLTAAGLRWVAAWGDYDGSPFEEESDRLIILTQKI